MLETYKKILESNSIVLVTHINPDGDTISSALALYAHLQRLGKKVYLYNKDKALPQNYDFLPNFKKFRDFLPMKFDLIIALDAGDFKRLGLDKSIKVPIINIDHHKSNTMFGDFNIVDCLRPSASLVVYDFLVANNIKISRDVANCIYTGLVSDTEFFLYGEVDAKVFEVTAKLVQAGAKPSFVAQNLKERDSLAKLRLTQYFLESIELVHYAKIGIGVVTKSDFERTGATISDSEHLVNIIISLSTVKLALFLREIDDGKFKFSLRSKGSLDVSSIALEFGGGGHLNAAGFIGKKDDLQKIIEKVEIKYE